MQLPEPTPQHRWLQQFIGEWEISTPEGDQHEASGEEVATGLGDLWVHLHSMFEMEGHPAESVTTIGFDADQGHFVGSWVGTMMTLQWIYEGHLIDGDTALCLECDGPAFDGSGRVDRYRDIHRWISQDERRLESYVRQESGEWKQFMTMRYRRISAS